MKNSYECYDLIVELECDIEEFGDIDMYAFFGKVQGYTFLIDYDFVEEGKEISAKEIENDTVMIMKASEILKILKKQNSII